MIKIYSHANTRHFISWLIMIVCCHNISWERFENTMSSYQCKPLTPLLFYKQFLSFELDSLLPVSELLSPYLATEWDSLPLFQRQNIYCDYKQGHTKLLTNTHVLKGVWKYIVSLLKWVSFIQRYIKSSFL